MSVAGLLLQDDIGGFHQTESQHLVSIQQTVPEGASWAEGLAVRACLQQSSGVWLPSQETSAI